MGNSKKVALLPCPACDDLNPRYSGDPGGDEFWIDCGGAAQCLIGPTRSNYAEAEAAWNALPRLSEPTVVEPLTVDEYDLGEGWGLGVTTYAAGFYCGLWHGETEWFRSGCEVSPAQAVLKCLADAGETEVLLVPPPASVCEKLADLASRAAREIALSLAAPSTTSEEAPHA